MSDRPEAELLVVMREFRHRDVTHDLRDDHGHKIRLPYDALLCPDPVHLNWHRRRKFLGHK
jgi:hypothetical protein